MPPACAAPLQVALPCPKQRIEEQTKEQLEAYPTRGWHYSLPPLGDHPCSLGLMGSTCVACFTSVV